MFLTKNKLKEIIKESLTEPDNTVGLKNQIEDLKKEIKELEFKKDMESKEIKHLVKMKEEKDKVQADKKEIELIKDFQSKEMKLQKEYHDKVVKLIQDEHLKIQDIYSKIMERLPNVSMNIEKKVRS
jgi:hypothetical protein